jgi:hypothetical protein
MIAATFAPAREIWWASLRRAIGAVVARFVHTEEVTGSNPVSPTVLTRGFTRDTVRRAGYVQIRTPWKTKAACPGAVNTRTGLGKPLRT